MTSINGLSSISATSIQNSGEIYLGNNLDAGTAGDTIVSNGPNNSVSWGTHTGTINALTAGTNISYASGNPTFNGSVADTINAAGTTYTGGSGISIVGTTISTSPSLPLSNSAGNIILNYHSGLGGLVVSAGQLVFNPDTTTIGINGVAPHYVEVLKVPNTLTINGTPYDGSAAVTLLTPDTTYIGSATINVDPFTAPQTINCLKVPNTLTINGTAYDGSAAVVLTTPDTTYQAGLNIYIDTTTTPDTIQLLQILTDIQNITFQSAGYGSTLTGNSYPSNPTVCTYLDLTSATNILPTPTPVGEVLKSLSFVDNVAQNYIIVSSTINKWIFDGYNSLGTDILEINFTATSTHGYLDYGFYANSYNPGVVFCLGVAVATGGYSPFQTVLSAAANPIDAYKLGLFDGTTTHYSLKEILDFDGYENVYTNSNFYFNNLTIGTLYRMALYGRVYSSGSIIINAGGKNSTGLPNRGAHQPTYLKFYEYDSTIGGVRN